MSGIVGNLLQLIDELGGILGRCMVISRGTCQTQRKRSQQRARDITFKILGSQEDAANVMLLNQVTDVGSNRRAIKAHHE